MSDPPMLDPQRASFQGDSQSAPLPDDPVRANQEPADMGHEASSSDTVLDVRVTPAVADDDVSIQISDAEGASSSHDSLSLPPPYEAEDKHDSPFAASSSASSSSDSSSFSSTPPRPKKGRSLSRRNSLSTNSNTSQHSQHSRNNSTSVGSGKKQRHSRQSSTTTDDGHHNPFHLGPLPLPSLADTKAGLKGVARGVGNVVAGVGNLAIGVGAGVIGGLSDVTGTVIGGLSDVKDNVMAGLGDFKHTVENIHIHLPTEKELFGTNVPQNSATSPSQRDRFKHNQIGPYCTEFLSILVTIMLATLCYGIWHEHDLSFFADTLDNWKLQPITHIRLYNGSCSDLNLEPLGYIEDYHYTIASCQCREDSPFTSHPYLACTKEQSKSVLNCTTHYSEGAPIPLPQWRGGQQLCLGRRGDNALERPRQSSHMACPQGYRVCNRDDCVRVNESCPITEVMFVPKGATYNTSLYPEALILPDNTILHLSPEKYQAAVNKTGNSLSVKLTRSDTMLLPGGKLVFRRSDSEAVQDSLRPMVNMVITSTNASDPHTYPIDSNDTGYRLIDTLPAPVLLSLNSPRSPPSSLPSLSIPSNHLSLLLSRNIPLPFNDAWALYARPEIIWSENCPVTRQQVLDLHPYMYTIRMGLLFLMILDLAFGALIFGSLCYLGYYRHRHPLHKRAKRCQLFSELAILVTTTLLTIITVDHYAFFHSMQSSSCSDAFVNGHFASVASDMIHTATALIVKGSLFVCYLLYEKLGHLCGFRMKQSEADALEEEAERMKEQQQQQQQDQVNVNSEVEMQVGPGPALPPPDFHSTSASSVSSASSSSALSSASSSSVPSSPQRVVKKAASKVKSASTSASSSSARRQPKNKASSKSSSSSSASSRSSSSSSSVATIPPTSSSTATSSSSTTTTVTTSTAPSISPITSPSSAAASPSGSPVSPSPFTRFQHALSVSTHHRSPPSSSPSSPVSPFVLAITPPKHSLVSSTSSSSSSSTSSTLSPPLVFSPPSSPSDSEALPPSYVSPSVSRPLASAIIEEAEDEQCT